MTSRVRVLTAGCDQKLMYLKFSYLPYETEEPTAYLEILLSCFLKLNSTSKAGMLARLKREGGGGKNVIFLFCRRILMKEMNKYLTKRMNDAFFQI